MNSPATKTRPVSVTVMTPTETTMERTTTQPATVHAYYEAHMFAKVTGYLAELKVDIGTVVKKGDVLAVLGIPEMDRQREAQLATIRRLEAEERRAASQLVVAKAGIRSHQAKYEKAKAELGKSAAGFSAAVVELKRVSDLVEQQAVADRLRDEAQKKHDAVARGHCRGSRRCVCGSRTGVESSRR
jgi:multidrug resistance efflux pump